MTPAPESRAPESRAPETPAPEPTAPESAPESTAPEVTGAPGERDRILAHLRAERAHVLAACEGLGEADLTRPAVPSGWSLASMVTHLTFDDEIFWGCAVLGGDEEAIALLQDGWSVPVVSGEEALSRYAAWCDRADAHLRAADLGAPPRWWPGPEVFPFPAFPQAAQAAWRLVMETATHAGHLDVARELIDGKQHMVLG